MLCGIYVVLLLFSQCVEYFHVRQSIVKTCTFQVLPKEDVETLNLCKSMMGRGEWPPLMVVFDPQEG